MASQSYNFKIEQKKGGEKMYPTKPREIIIVSFSFKTRSLIITADKTLGMIIKFKDIIWKVDDEKPKAVIRLHRKRRIDKSRRATIIGSQQALMQLWECLGIRCIVSLLKSL